MNPSDTELKNILSKARNIAVVGASGNTESASNKVMEFLIDEGYNVYPVNPKESIICGQTCYRSLHELPVRPDIVDVFRRSEFAAGVVNEAAGIGVPVVWLQEGVESEEAVQAAKEAGIVLISNLCIKKTITRLFSSESKTHRSQARQGNGHY